MKEVAALVLIVLSIVFVSITRAALHKEELSVINGGLTLVTDTQIIPQRHIVEIRGFKFDMSELTILEGDTVQWINKDIVPHTATADDTSWDSDQLTQNASWELVAKEGSTDSYFCRYHPTMKGTFTIQK